MWRLAAPKLGVYEAQLASPPNYRPRPDSCAPRDAACCLLDASVAMIPSTAQRVPDNTPDPVNEEIRRQTETNVARYGTAGPEAIQGRLAELDHEWDIERTLEANAATLALVGAGLALFVHRRFALVPLVVGGFLLQHAVQGWCPPVPIFRRLGIRTQTEIAHERYALKLLRGDFRKAADGDGALPSRALEAARA
jgi:hypothetical protein